MHVLDHLQCVDHLDPLGLGEQRHVLPAHPLVVGDVDEQRRAQCGGGAEIRHVPGVQRIEAPAHHRHGAGQAAELLGRDDHDGPTSS